MTNPVVKEKTKARKLRDLIERPGPFLVPNLYDAITAKYAERAGFEAVFMSGSSVASALGFPDVGLVTLSEAASQARYMANAVSLPVFCDCDTAYGNSLMAERTVREFEQVGAAGVMIEDQVPLSRAPWVGGVTVIPRDEFVGKIKAAAQARRDPDFVIVARVDCFEQLGYRELVERANACADVGADLVFIGGMPPEKVPQAPKDIKLPCFAWGDVDLKSAANLGYKVVLVGQIQNFLRRVMSEYFAELLRTGGRLDNDKFASESWSDFQAFMGTNEMLTRAINEYHEQANLPRSTPSAG